MGIREVKVWQFVCDFCKDDGGTITSQYEPSIPTGWTWRTIHGYGMCGGTVRDLRCEECTRKHKLDEEAQKQVSDV